jgi:hypothetical protein
VLIQRDAVAQHAAMLRVLGVSAVTRRHQNRDKQANDAAIQIDESIRPLHSAPAALGHAAP